MKVKSSLTCICSLCARTHAHISRALAQFTFLCPIADDDDCQAKCTRARTRNSSSPIYEIILFPWSWVHARPTCLRMHTVIEGPRIHHTITQLDCCTTNVMLCGRYRHVVTVTSIRFDSMGFGRIVRVECIVLDLPSTVHCPASANSI